MSSKVKLELGQMSAVDTAADYCHRMVQQEAAASGDVEGAMRRIETKTGINYWTIWALRYKRPKSIAYELYQQIRGAYFTLCRRELRKLEHELTIEAAKGGSDAVEDIVAEVEALAAKLRARTAGKAD